MITREVHPVADLFPMLAEDELAELAEDIKQRGLLQPIVLDAQGRVLDGRNRLAACEMAGVDPEFIGYHGDDPDGYALAVNIARRHLSKGQKAMIVATAEKFSATEAGLSIDADTSSIWRARVVRRHAEDLVALVVAGDLPLSEAYQRALNNKREAEAIRGKKIRLRDDAPDLLALVDEERMSLDDAIAALDGRISEEQRRQHEETVRRRQEIDTARAKAASLVADLQANVHAIRLGVEHGADGLVTKQMIADLRGAIDVLEEGL